MSKKKMSDSILPVFTNDSLARAISSKSAGEDGKAKYSLNEANEIIGLFKESIKDAIRSGYRVQLSGFLTITPSFRPSREGNNVHTNQKMMIPEAITLSVKAGKTLKDVARELDDETVAKIKEYAKQS